MVHDASTGETWSVPAVLGKGGARASQAHGSEEGQAGGAGVVLDVTGCGNAFCGGFLASRLAGMDNAHDSYEYEFKHLFKVQYVYSYTEKLCVYE